MFAIHWRFNFELMESWSRWSFRPLVLFIFNFYLAHVSHRSMSPFCLWLSFNLPHFHQCSPVSLGGEDVEPFGKNPSSWFPSLSARPQQCLRQEQANLFHRVYMPYSKIMDSFHGKIIWDNFGFFFKCWPIPPSIALKGGGPPMQGLQICQANWVFLCRFWGRFVR